MEPTKGAVGLQLPDGGIHNFEQVFLSLSHQHPYFSPRKRLVQ